MAFRARKVFGTFEKRGPGIGKLRMRKENANRAEPLVAVPERRTKRCSPRFRPADHFCKLSYGYLSPGIEGEKCQPLEQGDR